VNANWRVATQEIFPQALLSDSGAPCDKIDLRNLGFIYSTVTTIPKRRNVVSPLVFRVIRVFRGKSSESLSLPGHSRNFLLFLRLFMVKGF
jgi:hypothetical protein